MHGNVAAGDGREVRSVPGDAEQERPLRGRSRRQREHADAKNSCGETPHHPVIGRVAGIRDRALARRSGGSRAS